MITEILRNKILSLSYEKKTNTQIAEILGLSVNEVGATISNQNSIQFINLEKSKKKLPGAKHTKGGGVAFASLVRNQCKFSTTEHDSKKHLFCGEKTEDAQQYCEYHQSICYQKSIV